MGGHILKNLYICKVNIIFIIAVAFLCSGIVIATTCFAAGTPQFDVQELVIMFPVCYFFIYMCADITSSDLFEKDERAAWVNFAASTPLAGKGQVLGKYYTILIINIGISFLCFITDTVVSFISPETESMLTVLVMLFSLFIFFQSFTIPFQIRFGSKSGMDMRGAAVGVIIFIAAVYVLFGDISFLMSDDPIAELMKFLSSETPLLIMSVVPFISLALYFISYKLSLKLYNKGAENYGE